jgi:hypothetical protein
LRTQRARATGFGIRTDHASPRTIAENAYRFADEGLAAECRSAPIREAL